MSFLRQGRTSNKIFYEEYSLILLEFEPFTRTTEELREKSMMSLEKTGNIETEVNELLRRYKIGVLT